MNQKLTEPNRTGQGRGGPKSELLGGDTKPTEIGTAEEEMETDNFYP